MLRSTRKETSWGGRKLILESGRIARQADGAVLATRARRSCCARPSPAKVVKPGQDFFPLTVNYQEKAFAAGKIPGGFFKREGRPTEKETLTSRLIDRPIRPLFPDGFRNETQIVGTVLAQIGENDPDILAHDRQLRGADHQRRAVPRADRRRPGRLCEWRVRAQPDRSSRPQGGDLDLVVAGTRDAVMMVEVRGQGAVRGDDARRPSCSATAVPAGDRSDHRAGAGLCQGAMGAAEADHAELQRRA